MGTALVDTVSFPEYSGLRYLMMPYIQGDPDSLPEECAVYSDIISRVYLNFGDIGFLTIDESPALKGNPHRGDRSKFTRALHTEAGRRPYSGTFGWGGGGWGSTSQVTLDPDVCILLANNLDNSCAIWNATHINTSFDGDIGYAADEYPYEDAVVMQAGEVHQIGILTPHESLPVAANFNRQFLRIVGSGVHGREPYFTLNTLMGSRNHVDYS